MDIEARQTLPAQLSDAKSIPAVLLPYQASLLALIASEKFVVCEKSRRIGMTWAVAADAVLTAGTARTDGGMDAMYIGFNMDMAREFIDTAAMWAKAFIPAASAVEEFLFVDQTEDGDTTQIQAYRLRFASGFEIMALTSKPRSLRGRQGFVIFGEAAFHDELDEMLKAAQALTMWGGKVLVISTHDGADNPFNLLIQQIREGALKAKISRVSLDDALEDGLYERIALVTGLPQTEEGKLEWVTDLVGRYGDAAQEELYCIPRSGSGAYISIPAVEACMSNAHHVARLSCPDGFELRPLDERRAFVDKFLKEEVEPHLKKLDPELLSGLGEDFGRSMDLTVLAIGQERRDLSILVPLIIELRNMPIEQQFQVIAFVIENLKRFLGAKFDATGNGLGLAERTQEQYGFDRIEAVKLSQGYYLEHAPPLKKHFEDQSIELPADAEIKNDMRAVKLVRGIPSIPDTRQKGRHGDSFVALMLLIAALKTDYQPTTYARVKRDAHLQGGYRRISTTAGFNAREGLF